MKAKILVDDYKGHPPGWIPRWRVGEIGDLLENDFPEKYDFKILLPGTDHIDDLFGHGHVDTIRIYYFYKNEIELLEN